MERQRWDCKKGRNELGTFLSGRLSSPISMFCPKLLFKHTGEDFFFLNWFLGQVACLWLKYLMSVLRLVLYQHCAAAGALDDPSTRLGQSWQGWLWPALLRRASEPSPKDDASCHLPNMDCSLQCFQITCCCNALCTGLQICSLWDTSSGPICFS